MKIYLCLMLLALFACSKEWPPHELKEELMSQGVYLLDARAIDNVALQSTRDKPMSLSDVGQWQIVNFGYLSCPDVCSINLSLLNDVYLNWQSHSKEPLQITFISFDPERDTVEVLKPYLKAFNEDFLGLTGDLAQIKQLAKSLGVAIEHGEADENGHYFISHTDAFLIVNPEGKLVSMTKAPYKQEAILNALKLLISHD